MTAEPADGQAPAGAPSLTRPSEVRALLAQLDFKPSRVLGQNFLIDANILRILAEAAEAGPGDTVLEVGPGLGVLTEALIARAGRVIAIEKDARLHAWLQRRFEGEPRLDLRLGDALEADLPALFRGGATKLVSNLPYSVGSRILMEAFLSEAKPERIVVTVQKEVADRLAAAPDTKDYGLLSVWAQAGYAVRSHKSIPATCFLPAPEVTSAVVVLARLPRPLVDAEIAPRFKDLVRRAFGQRRKQIGKLLGNPGIMAGLGIDPSSRAERLSPADWARLAAAWPA